MSLDFGIIYVKVAKRFFWVLGTTGGLTLCSCASDTRPEAAKHSARRRWRAASSLGSPRGAPHADHGKDGCRRHPPTPAAGGNACNTRGQGGDGPGDGLRAHPPPHARAAPSGVFLPRLPGLPTIAFAARRRHPHTRSRWRGGRVASRWQSTTAWAGRGGGGRCRRRYHCRRPRGPDRATRDTSKKKHISALGNTVTHTRRRPRTQCKAPTRGTPANPRRRLDSGGRAAAAAVALPRRRAAPRLPSPCCSLLLPMPCPRALRAGLGVSSVAAPIELQHFPPYAGAK